MVILISGREMAMMVVTRTSRSIILPSLFIFSDPRCNLWTVS